MRKKILLIVLPILAVVLETLPTGTVMYFGNPDGEPFRQTFSYFDPIHWGYADFVPNLTALLTCVLLVLATVNAVKGTRRVTKAMAILAILAATLSLFVLIVGFTLIGLGIWLLLLLTALIAVLQKRNI